MFLSFRKYYPGCSFQIRIPDLDPGFGPRFFTHPGSRTRGEKSIGRILILVYVNVVDLVQNAVGSEDSVRVLECLNQPKFIKINKIFMTSRAGCPLWRVEGCSWSMGVVIGGPRRNLYGGIFRILIVNELRICLSWIFMRIIYSLNGT